jgi:hypothetical protein
MLGRLDLARWPQVSPSWFKTTQHINNSVKIYIADSCIHKFFINPDIRTNQYVELTQYWG